MMTRRERWIGLVGLVVAGLYAWFSDELQAAPAPYHQIAFAAFVAGAIAVLWVMVVSSARPTESELQRAKEFRHRTELQQARIENQVKALDRILQLTPIGVETSFRTPEWLHRTLEGLRIDLAKQLLPVAESITKED